MSACTSFDLRRAALIVVLVTVCFGTTGAAQPVTLNDEQVIFAIPDDAEGFPGEAPGPLRISPDGQSLLYCDPPGSPSSDKPVQLVILRLASVGGGTPRRVEFRPDLGRASARDVSLLFPWDVFSPDGKVFVSPDFNVPEPGGGIKRRPILVCRLATGEVVRTGAAVDLRYAAIDNTGTLLLDMDGQAYSLETGQPARRFGYRDLVRAANPVAPIVLVDSGVEGRPGPWRVTAWNLRDDKLLARLPHNGKFKYSAYVEPRWTSDGTFVYFGDAVGDRFEYGPDADERTEHVTRVWNVKTGQIVGKPLPWTRWRRPGPRAGTMILSTEFDGGTGEPRQFLHDAVTGATADLPVWVVDAGGDKVAYVKAIDGKSSLCVATLNWGAGLAGGGKKPPSPTPATKPVRSAR